MSKKPLINESVARRWAKYAGIENHSKSLLSEMYDEEMKEGDTMYEDDAGGYGEPEEDEKDDMLAELESMLSEQEEEELEVEDEPEAEEELEVEDEPEMEGSMSQSDVEAAVKAGLEAMAQAIGDSLKIKIDVRSGEEIEEPEAPEGEMEMAPEMGEEELMERVLKRVARRLVKESKKRK